MKFEIVIKEQIQLRGLLVELTQSQKSNYHIIRNQWMKFNTVLKQNRISLGANWKKYGITLKENNSYFYLTAIPFNQNIDNFFTYNIEDGYFAHFQHQGNMELIKTTIYNIYKNNIPNSDMKIDPNRELIHYEFYDSLFNWNRNDSIINIFVPILKM